MVTTSRSGKLLAVGQETECSRLCHYRFLVQTFSCVDIRYPFKEAYSFGTVSVSNDPLRKQLYGNESVTSFTIYLKPQCKEACLFLKRSRIILDDR